MWTIFYIVSVVFLKKWMCFISLYFDKKYVRADNITSCPVKYKIFSCPFRMPTRPSGCSAPPLFGAANVFWGPFLPPGSLPGSLPICSAFLKHNHVTPLLKMSPLFYTGCSVKYGLSPAFETFHTLPNLRSALLSPARHFCILDSGCCNCNLHFPVSWFSFTFPHCLKSPLSISVFYFLPESTHFSNAFSFEQLPLICFLPNLKTSS